MLDIFTVKRESAESFFKIHPRYRKEQHFNIFDYLKLEIFLPKNALSDSIIFVNFEVTDVGRGSDKEIEMTYRYEVQSHDSVSQKLTLIEAITHSNDGDRPTF
jgi:hypothetical protein